MGKRFLRGRAVPASHGRSWCFCFGVSAPLAPLLQAGFRATETARDTSTRCDRVRESVFVPSRFWRALPCKSHQPHAVCRTHASKIQDILVENQKGSFDGEKPRDVCAIFNRCAPNCVRSEGRNRKKCAKNAVFSENPAPNPQKNAFFV